MATTQLLSLTGVSKEYPGVKALNNVHFDLNKGEVHAIVGENGAGKSTLMKILSGIYKKDTGDIVYLGNHVNVKSPLEAQKLGISIIHQELNLMPDLTVAQNIFIGRKIAEMERADGAVLAFAALAFGALRADVDRFENVDLARQRPRPIEILGRHHPHRRPCALPRRHLGAHLDAANRIAAEREEIVRRTHRGQAQDPGPDPSEQRFGRTRGFDPRRARVRHRCVRRR